MVSHPTFQESWGMLVDMNFKVGDQLPRRVPKCLGRSSFGHTFRDCEISLVQLAEDGVDALLRLLAEAHRVRSAFCSIYTLLIMPTDIEKFSTNQVQIFMKISLFIL